MASVQTLEDTRVPPAAGRGGVDDGERGLLRALAAGDRSAADELVDRTYRKVYSFLARLCAYDAELAADLTQETYRKAWAALGGFHGKARFSTWLHRIAYTTFLNHRRRPQRLVAVEDLETSAAEAGPAAPAVPEPLALVTAGVEAERLRRAVLGLPDPLRYTVTARFWGELSVREIARQEQVTSVAIRKRLAKAMGLLADSLAVPPSGGEGPSLQETLQ